VIVAEGLLMYLPHDAVRALFTAVAGLSGPGSAFVFTWLPCDDQGQMDLDRVTQWGVKVVGEPIHFAIQPQRLGAFVAEHGWDLQPDVDLRATYLTGTPLADTPLTFAERFSVALRR
jgi:O-methyltransferase involved in polyketide biosynthesis